MLTVDGKEDVAVTVPGEGGVEHDGLPVVVGVVAVAIGHHLDKLVVGIGVDEVTGECAFTDVRHVDVHVRIVRAVAAGRVVGFKLECSDVAIERGQLSRVDDNLRVAVVVATVADGTVFVSGSGSRTGPVLSNTSVVAHGCLEGAS